MAGGPGKGILMKRNIALLLVVLFVLNLASPAYCDNALTKLCRGICNIITAPLEIPNRVGKVRDSSGLYSACTYGFIQGVVMMGLRMAVGMVEVGTFPLPNPEKYRPVLTDPEYFINLSPEKNNNG